MSALPVSIPEAIAARHRWTACPAQELLASPWRHALGVWWDGASYTSHPHGWRWTLQGAASERGGLVVSNDHLERGSRAVLSDLELAHCLAALELGRCDQLAFARLLRRRQSSGTPIGWAGASDGLVGATAEGHRTGTRMHLEDGLGSLGLTLVKVEVRP